MGAYDLDLHAWAREQADVLRRRSANELDWDKVAEEIESLGSQQQWELYNRLVVLLTHLIKWRAQSQLVRHDPRSASRPRQAPASKPEPQSRVGSGIC